MSWDLAYRPMLFADVLGQPGTAKVLQSRLVKGNALDCSYIFAGGHGQGKTSLSRILARAMLCLKLRADGEPCNQCDNCVAILNETSTAFTEQDAASRGTVDNMRSILEDLPFVLENASKRVYLFDEAHRMSKDAQDVLLKPIEDKKLVCIFCTTEPEKIRGAIRSRCEEYTIRKVTRDDILVRVKSILDKERVQADEDALLTVIDASGGHVRDILNKLEMLSQLGPITVEAVRSQLNLSLVSTYYEILIALGEPSKAIQLVEQACDRVGPEEVAQGLAEAAMSSYRLAHNMYSDFVYVDRALAKQVYEIYKDSTTALAKYFLRSYKLTKIGLVCDILACCTGIPTESETKVLVQVATAPVHFASAATQSIESVTRSPAPLAKTPVSIAVSPNSDKLRSDGIGAKGTKDICALTDMDHKGVPVSFPRGHHGQAPQYKALNKRGPETILTPEEWKLEFERLWKQRYS